MNPIPAAVSLIAAALLAATAGAADAATYAFTITGSGYAASGTVADDESAGTANQYPCAACAAGPGYLVTAISGTINGVTITGLAPLGTIFGNNNKLYPTSTPTLDWGDLGFIAGGISYNVFDGRYVGRPSQYLGVQGGSTYDNPVTFTFGAPGVPEPATWALLIGGFGLTGVALRRRGPVAA